MHFENCTIIDGIETTPKIQKYSALYVHSDKMLKRPHGAVGICKKKLVVGNLCENFHAGTNMQLKFRMDVGVILKHSKIKHWDEFCIQEIEAFLKHVRYSEIFEFVVIQRTLAISIALFESNLKCSLSYHTVWEGPVVLCWICLSFFVGTFDNCRKLLTFWRNRSFRKMPI